MQRTNLTPKQQKTLDFIKAFMAKHGQAPTVAELRVGLGLKALRSAAERVELLESKGFLHRTPYKHRNISLVNPLGPTSSPTGMIRVPVVASAGCDALQVYAEQKYDEFLTISCKSVGNSKKIAAIKAIGNSMVDAGIKNGDYAIVEVREDVSNGDRVAAILGDMAVIKLFKRTKDIIFLNPENKSMGYSPIVVQQEDVKIFGKVLFTISSAEENEDVDFSFEYEN